MNTDSVIVAFDPPIGKDTCVLVVGHREPNGTTKIINAFDGEKAKSIWAMLTKKENNNESGNRD